ncbi:hypothetical protein [Serratia sp. CY76391]|uniref:hypothetical protein n=1 Tax=Serratia sp. CY76391 TaxID=3383681 RepID=UPI003FA0BEB1
MVVTVMVSRVAVLTMKVKTTMKIKATMKTRAQKTTGWGLLHHCASQGERWMRPVGACVVALWLAGCALPSRGHPPTTVAMPVITTSAPARPVRTGQSGAVPPSAAGDETVPMPLPAGGQGPLNTCLFEAHQLARLGSAYRSQVDALYRHLRAAKYYAAIAGELSGGTTDTITPLYQYRVNDACNAISQSLLTELKKVDMPGRDSLPIRSKP